MTPTKNPYIQIIPLGGLGAIGKNITLFEYNDDIIIVDCGIMFPIVEAPGIDYIIPDFSYIEKNRERIRAIIITHGHEDHIGALPYLLQIITVPIYATKLTIGLIQSRLSERPPRKDPQYIEITPRMISAIGSFKIEFIRVNHSIVDGTGLAIQTEMGTIIHTGDFKIDFSPVDGDVTDIYRFAEYGEKGVLLLMSDSTNAEREGFTQSESILDNKLIDIFSSTKGRIIFASFASNINRIQQILDVAQKFNRKVALSGLSMLKNVEISKSLGYLNIKENLIIDIEKTKELPDKKLVIIGTGSQGEPMSAIYRMAMGTHRSINIKNGDFVIITASVIPGNEKMVTNVINTLMKLGAEVYYNRDSDIHVSGHGSAKELKLMISITKPKFFMPIHGEFKQLKAHARIAESLKIKQSRIILAENGSLIQLNKKNYKIKETLNLSQIYVDGSETGNIDSNLIRERQAMSSEGIVIVSLVVAEGMLVREAEVITRGFIKQENTKIIKQLKIIAEKNAHKMLEKEQSLQEIESNLKKDIKKIIFKMTKRNALVVIQVLDI